MEQYHQNCVNYQQADWVQWLPLAEFAANNHTSETMNCFAFFSNYGIHPQMIFSQHPIKDPNDIGEVNTQQMAQRMEEHFSKLSAEMKRAQTVQSTQANKSQRAGTSLEVGNKVWLDARNVSTNQSSRYLDWKCIGPYEITDVISPWAC
jgi:hypothetical protein